MGGKYPYDPARHGNPEARFNLDEHYFIVNDTAGGGKELLLFKKHVPTVTIAERPGLTIKKRGVRKNV